MTASASLEQLPGFMASKTLWHDFQGQQRVLPEVWRTEPGGPEQLEPACETALQPDASLDGLEPVVQWAGLADRPAQVRLEAVPHVLVNIWGTVISLYSGEAVDDWECIEYGRCADNQTEPRRLFSWLGLLRPEDPALVSQDYFSGRISDRFVTMHRFLAGHFQQSCGVARGLHDVDRAAVLLDPWLLNYGHWCTMGLSRLVMLAPLLLSHGQHIHALVYATRFTLDALKLLGVQSSRILSADACSWYRIGTAYFAGPRAWMRKDNLSMQSGSRIRKLLLKSAHAQLPRLGPALREVAASGSFALALDRGRDGARRFATRALANFQAVLRVMRDVMAGQCGGQAAAYVCGEHSVAAQITVFSEASLVLGIDGGCIANVLWMRSGAAVVSLVPVREDYFPMPVAACGTFPGWRIADSIGVRSIALLLPSAGFKDQFMSAPLSVVQAILRRWAMTSCDAQRS